jgi:hypothetical protein
MINLRLTHGDRIMTLENLYPPNWPRCPVCGEPAMDGHLPCGGVTYGEAEQRDRMADGWRQRAEEREWDYSNTTQREGD